MHLNGAMANLVKHSTEHWSASRPGNCCREKYLFCHTAVTLITGRCVRTWITLPNLEVSPALGRKLDELTVVLSSHNFSPIIFCVTKSFSMIIWEPSGCSQTYNINKNINSKILVVILIKFVTVKNHNKNRSFMKCSWATMLESTDSLNVMVVQNTWTWFILDFWQTGSLPRIEYASSSFLNGKLSQPQKT